MRYYKNSVDFIRKQISKKFPAAAAKMDQDDMPSYLLWMMEEMQKFDDSLKAARWIGWIFAHAEMLGLLSNTQSRNLSRNDVKEKYI